MEMLAPVAEGILRHPNFDRAVRHYACSALRWRSGQYLLNKISGTHARGMIVGYLMILHYEAEATGADDGATYLKILGIINARNERSDCSPRVLKTVLAICQFGGLVTTTRSLRDRRVKFYRPTHKMIAMLRDWYVQTFGCFDALFGVETFAARIDSEDGALRDLIVSFGRPYVDLDIQVVGHDPDIYDLFMMEGGFVVASSLVDAALRGAPTDSARAIADRFGASASQVRHVLKRLQQKQLIVCSPDGRLRDWRGLMEKYRAHVARELALYAKYALDLEDYFTSGRCANAAVGPAAADDVESFGNQEGAGAAPRAIAQKTSPIRP